MNIFGLFQLFVLSYKKIDLFTDIEVNKSLILVSNLRVPKIDKMMSKSL